MADPLEGIHRCFRERGTITEALTEGRRCLEVIRFTFHPQRVGKSFVGVFVYGKPTFYLHADIFVFTNEAQENRYFTNESRLNLTRTASNCQEAVQAVPIGRRLQRVL